MVIDTEWIYSRIVEGYATVRSELLPKQPLHLFLPFFKFFQPLFIDT